MAVIPINSITAKAFIPPADAKQASVAIILFEKDGNLSFLLTKRTSNVEHHKGQISLPGGAIDLDEMPKDASLRESNEEINLNVDDVQYLGSLHYLVSKHKIEVNPFVGLITKRQNFIDNAEIAHTFTVPLDFLLNNAREHKIDRKNTNVIVPSWVYNDQTIWGLTAMITADFLNICFDADVKADLDIIREHYDY